jgi:hypothetical protein
LIASITLDDLFPFVVIDSLCRALDAFAVVVELDIGEFARRDLCCASPRHCQATYRLTPL